MYGQLRMIMGSGSVLGHFLQALPAACLAGLLYLLLAALRAKKGGKPAAAGKIVLNALFVCYLTGLFSLVILPANFWLRIFDGLFLGQWRGMGPLFSYGGFNTVPAFVKVLKGHIKLTSWTKTMLARNVAMFLPLGFLLPFVKRTGKWAALATAVLVPAAVEALQMISGRSFDVDDLLCNFVGIGMGFLMAFALKGIGNGVARRKERK